MGKTVLYTTSMRFSVQLWHVEASGPTTVWLDTLDDVARLLACNFAQYKHGNLPQHIEEVIPWDDFDWQFGALHDGGHLSNWTGLMAGSEVQVEWQAGGEAYALGLASGQADGQPFAANLEALAGKAGEALAKVGDLVRDFGRA